MQDHLQHGDTTQATTSTRVAAMPPADSVPERGDHDEDGQLDRLDDPVELQRRGGPAGQPQSRATERSAAASVAAASPALGAGHVDQVGLGLDQDGAERGEGAEERPTASRSQDAPDGAAQPEADEQRRPRRGSAPTRSR